MVELSGGRSEIRCHSRVWPQGGGPDVKVLEAELPGRRAECVESLVRNRQPTCRLQDRTLA